MLASLQFSAGDFSKNFAYICVHFVFFFSKSDLFKGVEASKNLGLEIPSVQKPPKLEGDTITETTNCF